MAIPPYLLIPAALAAFGFPHTAVVGQPWHLTLRAPAAPTIVAGSLRTRAVGAHGVYRATLKFPAAGAWQVSEVLRGRTTRLGTVTVDVPRDPLLANPFTIAVEPSGSLLVGQLDGGPLLRVVGARATKVADVTAVHVSDGYVATFDGAVARIDGTVVARGLDADAVAADPGGNLYVSVYAGFVRKIAPNGTVTTIADSLNHPHSLVYWNGALYVADTENRRIRRIDLASGAITTFGGDVGITVSLAVGPDGSIYSADVVRDGAGGGVTRTTPTGTTSRILSSTTANGVAVAADGTVYVNLWEEKRIDRLDRAGRLVPVARG